MLSVEVERFLAVAAAPGSPESSSAAMGADVTFLFLHYPLFGAEFPPSGDGPQYDLLADRNWEIVD